MRVCVSTSLKYTRVLFQTVYTAPTKQGVGLRSKLYQKLDVIDSVQRLSAAWVKAVVKVYSPQSPLANYLYYA